MPGLPERLSSHDDRTHPPPVRDDMLAFMRAFDLVLDMLEELNVADEHRVLEIGTGTGYNAALLCTRLGSTKVTSVDIDPELVDLARERLAANGHTPTLP